MNLQGIKNRIRKILAYLLTSIVFLVISAFLALQIPAVQDYLVDRYLGSFSQVIGFPSQVQNFRLLWFDRLEMENVLISDPENNEMIKVERMLINFKLNHLLDGGDVNIDGVSLRNARVNVTRISENDTSRNLNINVFIDRINQRYGGTSTGGRSPRVNIGEAMITESEFSYIDQEDNDSIDEGFNYHQFALSIDEAQLHNFMILGDTTQFDLNTLIATDAHTKAKVKEMSTFFRYCQKSMEFTKLSLRLNESTITDSVVFRFDRHADLSDFNNKVKIHAHFNASTVFPEDLALFVPEAKVMTQPFQLNGKLNGFVHNFRFTDMKVLSGNSVLKGTLDMEGLPNINETFIFLELEDSRVDFNDLAFAIGDRFVPQLTPIGRVSLDGEFLGYPTDFVAKGTFHSKLGKIESDINFKVNEKDFNRSEYSGELKLKDFHLGQYLKDTTNFQRVNLDGKINGSGLTLSTADFKLNGQVKSIGIRNYNYSNITTNARFASELFKGFLKINDPNLEFWAEGSVDLRDAKDEIKIKARIDTANLHALNLTNQYLFLHSNVNVNSRGLHLDSLVGNAELTDLVVHYDDRHLSLADVKLNVAKAEDERLFEFTSTLFDGEARGDFLLTDISQDVERLVKEIGLSIKNDEKKIRSYYRSQREKPKSYQTTFTINVKNIEPLAGLLKTDIALSKNTRIEGTFTSGYTSILQAYTRIDSLTYDQTLFLQSDVEFTASKIADSTSILAVAFVNSRKQYLSPKLHTNNLLVEAIWNKNIIEFTVDADQDKQDNYVRLKGEVDFLRDTTEIKMLPSKIHLLGKDWIIDERNIIAMSGKTIDVNDLKVRHQDQFILFDGTIGEDTDDEMSLQIHNLDLSVLNSITGRKISGRLEALFDLTNYYTNPYVENNLTVDSLAIDNFLIGDISGENRWDNEERKFVIDFFVDREDRRIVNLNGSYNPQEKSSPLDVTAKLDKANLKILEPFFDYAFSDLAGTISGEYHIGGKLQSPLFSGEAQIDGGKIRLKYLQTLYAFEGTIGLTPNSVFFKNISLADALTGKGTLNGTISHQNFANTRINIDVDFENIHVLNTTPKDNTLFYGQGYATGDLNIFGPVSNLKFTANARTEKNTRISIPFGGISEVEQKDFIKFVSFSDSTFQKKLTDDVGSKLDLTGITLDFNLDVTPDAYCEIILDLKAGDIITGRGNGEIQLQLDTKGEFNMFGPFEFTEGDYNFTLYDIINKDFDIKSGSRITWYGDPYSAIVDISATYDQAASLAPIIDDPVISTSVQLRRKYPVQVLIELDGNMFSPTTNFDIVARELPQSIIVNSQPVRLDFYFQAFKNKIDEQELKRQVFSLIVLRRFSPPESFNTSGGDVVNSVSELFSNQLSTFVSQVDENLEIDVDFSRMDEEQFNTFQLRLSYTFLNGRLRITRDGTFYSNQGNNTASNTNQNLSSIAGDWTVDYMLTADGKLKVKMYNRTNINPILNTIGTANSVTTGVSLTHTQNFNQLRDIWRSARKRREAEEKRQQKTNIDSDKDLIRQKDDEDGE